ncbi:hypothetical protein Ddye_031158 [Dipteronia dyeriana]|uniref:Uncharacterized protein n=1 Tax=Dipteronia dyeriana TaxID=168575 RepID=A0AAD9TIF6_9ROSI|nr:hypothetical protein Ddye_031158 [Dipteronia dyeriana]
MDLRNSRRDRYDRFQYVVQRLKLEGKEVTFEDIPKTWTFSIQSLEKVSSLRDAFNLLMVIDSELLKERDEANTICNCLKVIDEAVQWFSGSRGLTTNLFFFRLATCIKRCVIGTKVAIQRLFS